MIASWKGCVLKYLGIFRTRLQFLDSRIRGFEDFFDFPFDISKPMPKSALDQLIILISFMNENDLDYRLADGSLLGIYRDGTLIEHDTDLDFYFSDSYSLELAVSFLLGLGYQVGRKLSKGDLIFQYSLYSADNLLVDFLLWHPLDNEYFYWEGPEIRRRRIQPKSNFMDHSYISLGSHVLKTFKDVPEWLQSVYGHNWQIPESIKSDWRIGIGDLEPR